MTFRLPLICPNLDYFVTLDFLHTITYTYIYIYMENVCTYMDTSMIIADYNLPIK